MKKMLMTSCVTMLVSFCLNAQANGLKTETGNEIGLTISSYEYKEPAVNSTQKATKFGVDYHGSIALNGGGDWFLGGDLRYANGQTDYTSQDSGNKNGNDDWYYEARGLIGKDIQVGNNVYSAYTGFGYRHLYNDMRGASSNGSIGYQRESSYTYLPVGVTHRMMLNNNARLSTNLEYDHLISGTEKTHLSDLVGNAGITSADDVSNNQNDGYALRLSVNYEMNRWSAGPYVTYWDIKKSDTVNFVLKQSGSTYNMNSIEPDNKTTEIGIKASYHF